MLRSSERDDETLRVETGYDNESAEFVVFLRYPDGTEYSERFVDGEEFGRRLEALEQDLGVQRWIQRALPFVLPYRWPSKPPR